MFRRSDFRKLELFGGGKKNTKVFKVEYIATGQIFALKEVEAKNNYKGYMSNFICCLYFYENWFYNKKERKAKSNKNP